MTGSFVVTGGARDIGLAIVRRLAREGTAVPVDSGRAAQGLDPEAL